MNKKNYIFLNFLILTSAIFAQNKTKFSAEIATWYYDKPGAVSISFDDASYTQYEFAYPILEQYGFKATFSLVGTWTHEKATYSAEPGYFEIKKMGWQEIKELHDKGHEIAAHGYKHIRYKKYASVQKLAKQMKQVKDLIENHIQSPVYTLHYPYSFTSDSIVAASKRAGFLFGRTGNDAINPVTPANMHLLESKAIINNHNPDETQFKKWLNQAKGKWLILMYHHLFPDDSKEMKILRYHKVTHTYSLLPDTFQKQMQALSGQNAWVAPIATVGKYVVEREHTKIKLRKFCHKLYIKTATNLDTTVYNQPLTIKVKLPWKKVKIRKGKESYMYNVKNQTLFLDILPNSKIIIKKLK